MGWPNAANLVYDFSGKLTLNRMDYASKFELEFLYFTKQNKIYQLIVVFSMSVLRVQFPNIFCTYSSIYLHYIPNESDA